MLLLLYAKRIAALKRDRSAPGVRHTALTTTFWSCNHTTYCTCDCLFATYCSFFSLYRSGIGAVVQAHPKILICRKIGQNLKKIGHRNFNMA